MLHFASVSQDLFHSCLEASQTVQAVALEATSAGSSLPGSALPLQGSCPCLGSCCQSRALALEAPGSQVRALLWNPAAARTKLNNFNPTVSSCPCPRNKCRLTFSAKSPIYFPWWQSRACDLIFLWLSAWSAKVKLKLLPCSAFFFQTQRWEVKITIEILNWRMKINTCNTHSILEMNARRFWSQVRFINLLSSRLKMKQCPNENTDSMCSKMHQHSSLGWFQSTFQAKVKAR